MCIKGKGVNVEWGGPNSTSHDLIGKDVEYEIKSSTSRYEKVIHIAGQFQMQKTKRLFCISVDLNRTLMVSA